MRVRVFFLGGSLFSGLLGCFLLQGRPYFESSLSRLLARMDSHACSTRAPRGSFPRH